MTIFRQLLNLLVVKKKYSRITCLETNLPLEQSTIQLTPGLSLPSQMMKTQKSFEKGIKNLPPSEKLLNIS